jgi:cell division protein FtsB
MLDKSKLKLKTALHGLEISIGKLITQIEDLKKENELLKAENQKIKSHPTKIEDQFELKKEFLVKESESSEMLDSEAVSSIDMSIKELKNMVKKQ